MALRKITVVGIILDGDDERDREGFVEHFEIERSDGASGEVDPVVVAALVAVKYEGGVAIAAFDGHLFDLYPR